MSTAGVELPYLQFPRPSFRTKLLGGESNVRFVCKLASPVHRV